MKKPRTTEAQRVVARTPLKEGYTQSEVALRTKMSQASVSNAMKRSKETGNDCNRKSKQNGRPRISTDCDDRFLARRSLQDRFKPATHLKDDWEKIGVYAITIRRRRRPVNLTGRAARKKPMLTANHKRRRLDFAKKHKSWSKEKLEDVLWTDESPFSVFGECGKKYVRRRPGEEFNPECVRPTMKQGGGKIQVWGLFYCKGRWSLHHIKGIMDQKVYKQILIHHMRPSLMQFGGKDQVIFQLDNDPKHTAKSVQKYIKRAQYKVHQNWPAQSPDLNPIENLWKELKTRLTCSSTASAFKQGGTFNLLKREWKALPQNLLINLVHSMPRHIRAVMQAKGGHTKY